MATAPISVVRQQDGRHAVTDATGAVLGRHNSVWSAARQMHDYYGGDGVNQPQSAAGAMQPIEPGDVEPAREAMEAKRVGSKQTGIFERPKVPHPPKDRPRTDRPKIPRP